MVANYIFNILEVLGNYFAGNFFPLINLIYAFVFDIILINSIYKNKTFQIYAKHI